MTLTDLGTVRYVSLFSEHTHTHKHSFILSDTCVGVGLVTLLSVSKQLCLVKKKTSATVRSNAELSMGNIPAVFVVNINGKPLL